MAWLKAVFLHLSYSMYAPMINLCQLEHVGKSTVSEIVIETCNASRLGHCSADRIKHFAKDPSCFKKWGGGGGGGGVVLVVVSCFVVLGRFFFFSFFFSCSFQLGRFIKLCPKVKCMFPKVNNYVHTVRSLSFSISSGGEHTIIMK